MDKHGLNLYGLYFVRVGPDLLVNKGNARAIPETLYRASRSTGGVDGRRIALVN